jgi:hypothetical protein
MVEAHMDVLLLNVLGSAAVASAVVVAVMTNRLSRELAGMLARESALGPRPGH